MTSTPGTTLPLVYIWLYFTVMVLQTLIPGPVDTFFDPCNNEFDICRRNLFVPFVFWSRYGTLQKNRATDNLV